MNDHSQSEAVGTSEDARFHWPEGMKYAIEGIKALFLLNGAATISILTFIGNENSGDNRLVYSMFCFALAALLGPIAFLSAYLTQLNYGNSDSVRASKFHFRTYVCFGMGVVFFVLGVVLSGLAFLDFAPQSIAGI